MTPQTFRRCFNSSLQMRVTIQSSVMFVCLFVFFLNKKLGSHVNIDKSWLIVVFFYLTSLAYLDGVMWYFH